MDLPIAMLSPNGLLLLALAAIIGLIVLIARFKCNAFIALMIASLVVGVGSGMPLPGISKSFQEGVGNTLGFLAMIIGLGTILGKLLAESGAAEVIANRMVNLLGIKRLDYAVMLVAFLVGISVFFGVGIVLLGPIAFMLARQTKTPILYLALPLAAGLSVAHGLIPPHPGPMVAIGKIGADTGKTILWSIAVGLPTALITGPFLARWVAPRVPVAIGGLGAEASGKAAAPRPPGFALSIFTMLLPVLLMLVATAADVSLPPENTVRQVADFIGAPVVAMLIAVVFSFWAFGTHCGLKGGEILKFTEQCVGPAASIFLVVGAGGGFSKVLEHSGVAKAIADLAVQIPVTPILLGWIIAGLLRIAVGSATVSITMAAGLMLPVVEARPDTNRELLVLAMGAGSLILSHVNDSGFWFVKEYLGMSISQTLKTWTVVETGIAVVSIVIILLANAVI
ncbi:permease DsdX [Luteolibacter yonseiensis]|uniref:Permease DsdX n=2 Tax=Luteolibacter yonseiensis TaxID=1144680 RepID=A0A934R7X6_9BACT|nr:permease DsdX [Luteolibacter yonseiensis]